MCVVASNELLPEFFVESLELGALGGEFLLLAHVGALQVAQVVNGADPVGCAYR